MLEALNFVKGSVAKDSSPVQELSHFMIENGQVKGSNGIITICSPIPLEFNCIPKASSLIRAIGICVEEDEGKPLVLSMTPSGKLNIKRGKFKSFIECLQTSAYHGYPTGSYTEVNAGALTQALISMIPMVSKDKSSNNTWARGILWKNSCLHCTNNVVMVQKWVKGIAFPQAINIPLEAVLELKRIKELPIRVQVDENSITFHWEGMRWMKCQLASNNWPDFDKVLNRDWVESTLVTEELIATVKAIKPMVDEYGKVYFNGTNLSTAETEGHSFDVECPKNGIYQHDGLTQMLSYAVAVDWSQYPKAALWVGKQEDYIRGAIIGMRD